MLFVFNWKKDLNLTRQYQAHLITPHPPLFTVILVIAVFMPTFMILVYFRRYCVVTNKGSIYKFSLAVYTDPCLCWGNDGQTWIKIIPSSILTYHWKKILIFFRIDTPWISRWIPVRFIQGQLCHFVSNVHPAEGVRTYIIQTFRLKE